VAEFGYMVVTAERRRGYAEEAVRALLTWAECQPAVRIFRATVDPDNSASISLLRKLGFTEAGRERHAQRGEEVVFLRRVE
jgi:ribosomal-protein-alanine N-acetyltransferase